MKNDNFYTIRGWMINELKLSGNLLNLYAFIFGFYENGKMFNGAMKYLSESLGISKQSTLKLLKNLVEKNLILKFEIGPKGHKRCDYKINPDAIEKISGKESLPQENIAVKKVDRRGKESLPPSGKESCHHIDIHKDIHIDIYNESQKQAFELSQLLLTSHRKEFPDYFSGKNEKEIGRILDGWAKDIELLIRIDKKEPKIIRQVIMWVKTPNNFWFHNIESGAKLRKQFERLYGEMVSKQKLPSNSQRHRIAADNVPQGKALSYFREG
jgi:DNA-binding Lrp family transcriptional regulator